MTTIAQAIKFDTGILVCYFEKNVLTMKPNSQATADWAHITVIGLSNITYST